MGWEIVPMVRADYPCPRFPFPVARAHQYKHGKSIRLTFNVVAERLLPQKLVFLRNGSQLAFRAPHDDDPLLAARNRTGKGPSYVTATGLLEAGQRFKLIQQGEDMWLLEPFDEEPA